MHSARFDANVGETLNEARRSDDDAQFIMRRNQLESPFVEPYARLG